MRFRPYDLVVVPRERLALYPEHFTVSANGVMMVRRGVQAEFVPLASWVRQASLFDLVSNIGFFKNYVTGRAFRRWHKASCQARLEAAQIKHWPPCILMICDTATAEEWRGYGGT
jgi:dynein heavy chain